MRIVKTLGKSIIVLLSFFITHYTFGNTYTSINDGYWDNERNVWSIDGETPCKCSPGRISNGNDIIINNDILTSYDVIINNYSQLTVSRNGSLTGSYSAYAINAVLNLKGKAEFGKYFQESNTSLNVSEGGIFNLFSSCSILGGEFNFSKSEMFLTSGDLFISKNAVISLKKKSAIHIDFGELKNEGLICNDSNSHVNGIKMNSMTCDNYNEKQD